MNTNQSIKLVTATAAVLSIVAWGCNRNPEIEAVEETAEQERQAIDRAEEATKEAAEGVVEADNAARGEGEIRQEIEGMKARRIVDEEYDEIEKAHERAVEEKKEAIERRSKSLGE